MAAETEVQTVPWWTPPGETDTTAFAALILLFLLEKLLFWLCHLLADAPHCTGPALSVVDTSPVT